MDYDAYTCPQWAPILGFGGCAFAVALSSEWAPTIPENQIISNSKNEIICVISDY
jgi:hypothetical protein